MRECSGSSRHKQSTLAHAFCLRLCPYRRLQLAQFILKPGGFIKSVLLLLLQPEFHGINALLQLLIRSLRISQFSRHNARFIQGTVVF